MGDTCGGGRGPGDAATLLIQYKVQPIYFEDRGALLYMLDSMEHGVHVFFNFVGKGRRPVVFHVTEDAVKVRATDVTGPFKKWLRSESDRQSCAPANGGTDSTEASVWHAGEEAGFLLRRGKEGKMQRLARFLKRPWHRRHSATPGLLTTLLPDDTVVGVGPDGVHINIAQYMWKDVTGDIFSDARAVSMNVALPGTIRADINELLRLCSFVYYVLRGQDTSLTRL